MIEEEEVGYPRPNTSHFQRLKSRRSNFLNFMKSTDLWILGSSVASMANLYILQQAACLHGRWRLLHSRKLYTKIEKEKETRYILFSATAERRYYTYMLAVLVALALLRRCRAGEGKLEIFKKKKKCSQARPPDSKSSRAWYYFVICYRLSLFFSWQ